MFYFLKSIFFHTYNRQYIQIWGKVENIISYISSKVELLSNCRDFCINPATLEIKKLRSWRLYLMLLLSCDVLGL